MKTATKTATKTTKKTTVGKALRKVGLVKSVVVPTNDGKAPFVKVVGTKTISKPKKATIKQPDPNILVQFVTQRGKRVGCVVAVRVGNCVAIGTALCRRQEQFVQKQAVTTATGRAQRAMASSRTARKYLHVFAPSMFKDVMDMVYRCARFYKGAQIVLIPHRGSFQKGCVSPTNGIAENVNYVQGFILHSLDSLDKALPGYRDYAIKREADYQKVKEARKATDALVAKIKAMLPEATVKIVNVVQKNQTNTQEK